MYSVTEVLFFQAYLLLYFPKNSVSSKCLVKYDLFNVSSFCVVLSSRNQFTKKVFASPLVWSSLRVQNFLSSGKTTKNTHTDTHAHTHIRTCWSLTAVWLALSRGWMESVKLWWMATERQRGGRGGIFWRKGVEEKVPIKWSLLYSTLSFLIALNRLWINSWMWSFVFGQTGRSWHEGGVGCVCASTAVWQSGSEMGQQV